MEFACWHEFSPGAPVSPTVKTCIGVPPVSTLDQGIGSGFRVSPRALHCDRPMLLRDGLNAENTFHCTLYV